MENNRTYTGNISVSIFKPNYNISFHNHAGEKIGTLDFNTDRLVFTGNAEESAKVFIDFIAQSFAKRLEEERQAEREACAKLCETHAPTTTPTWVSYASEIRARGNHA
jgi:hypothetical protein